MDRDALRELWSRRLHGEALSPPDEAALLEALESDRELREEFLRDEQLDGSLSALGRSREDAAAFAQEFSDRIRVEGDAKRFASRIRRSVQADVVKTAPKSERPSGISSRTRTSHRSIRLKPRKRAWLWPLAAAASVALIAGAAAWRSLHAPPPEVAQPAQGNVQPQIVAQITALSGAVTITTQTSLSTARPGAEVADGNGIAVKDGASVTLKLADGSMLDLSSASNIAHIRNADGILLAGVTGTLRAKAAKQAPGQALRIETANAEVRILGTEFKLVSGTSGDRLEVREGSVRFIRKADGASIDVAEGTYAVVAPGVELAAKPLGKPLGPVVNVNVPTDAVAYLPDGQRLLAGCHDGAHVWDLASGEKTHLKGHTDRVRSVAISRNNEFIATGSWDHTVKIWNAATLKETYTLRGHKHQVWAVAFSPDGRTLASASFDKTIRLWDPATGKEKRNIDPAISEVLALAYSPDGRYLAAGGTGSIIKLFDARTMKELRTLRGHTSVILSLAFSPDSTLLASGSQDKTIRLWDVASGQTRRTLSGHTADVRGLAFEGTGSRLLSASVDQSVRLWNVASGAELKNFSGHSGWVSSVSVAPGGSTFVTSSYDGTIRQW